jgi:hypothetical protein
MRTLICIAALLFSVAAASESPPRFVVAGGTLTLGPLPAGFLVPVQAPQLTPRPTGVEVFYVLCEKAHVDNLSCGYTTAPHLIAFQLPDRTWIFQAVTAHDEIDAEWRVRDGGGKVRVISANGVPVESSQTFQFVEIEE